MSTIDQLTTQLDRLASFEAGPFPVLSLYLDLRPNERGRDSFEPFLKKELAERIDTYPAKGPERESLQHDADKVRRYLDEVDKSLNGLALFASSGAQLFEAVPLAASAVDGHRLYLSNQAHLYPLAKLVDQYPRYVALLADTHLARIFVFAANGVEKTNQVEGTKTRRHKMGGWSQARYQRHVDNFHVQHAKEVVDTLDRIVRDENIHHVVVAGDDVIVPLLREQMPKHLAERIVDVVKLDIRAPEREILETTIATLRDKDAAGDRERVDALVDAYRGSGLACVGVAAIKKAFEMGQVEELLVPASPDAIALKGKRRSPETHESERSEKERAADELITRAHQTSARVRFIEEASLLEPLGGVAAFLRFKL
jgi:peptide chain release factor subunit 1